MDFWNKAEQISCSASFNSGIVLALAAGYGKTPALPSNVIIQWIKIGWIGGALILGDEVATVWLQPFLSHACRAKPERRLAGRCNHLAAHCSQSYTSFGNIFSSDICCADIHLLVHKVQMPLFADTCTAVETMTKGANFSRSTSSR